MLQFLLSSSCCDWIPMWVSLYHIALFSVSPQQQKEQSRTVWMIYVWWGYTHVYMELAQELAMPLHHVEAGWPLLFLWYFILLWVVWWASGQFCLHHPSCHLRLWHYKCLSPHAATVAIFFISFFSSSFMNSEVVGLQLRSSVLHSKPFSRLSHTTDFFFFLPLSLLTYKVTKISYPYHKVVVFQATFWKSLTLNINSILFLSCCCCYPILKFG